MRNQGSAHGGARNFLVTSLVLLAATLATPSNAKGQATLLVLLLGPEAASENFYFSMKVGANLADVTNFEGGSRRIGWNFGLLANIKLSDQFYLVPEFAPVSAKRISEYPTVSTGDPTFDALLGSDNKTTFEFNYLDIPVVLKYYPITDLSKMN